MSDRRENEGREAEGFDLTPNERAWVEFIRLASCDADPRPTLRRVQQLRRIFEQDRPDDDR